MRRNELGGGILWSLHNRRRVRPFIPPRQNLIVLGNFTAETPPRTLQNNLKSAFNDIFVEQQLERQWNFLSASIREGIVVQG